MRDMILIFIGVMLLACGARLGQIASSLDDVTKSEQSIATSLAYMQYHQGSGK